MGNTPNILGLDGALLPLNRFGTLECVVKAGGVMSFMDLMRQLRIHNPGTLNGIIHTLQRAGILEQRKSFRGEKPLTEAVVTDAGRDAYARHVAAISAIAALSTSAKLEMNG